jgi:hypothetical protein
MKRMQILRIFMDFPYRKALNRGPNITICQNRRIILFIDVITKKQPFTVNIFSICNNYCKKTVYYSVFFIIFATHNLVVLWIEHSISYIKLYTL